MISQQKITVQKDELLMVRELRQGKQMQLLKLDRCFSGACRAINKVTDNTHVMPMPLRIRQP